MILGFERSPRISPSSSLKRKFGEKVQELRIQRKMTQEQLGEVLSFDRAYVSAIETGKKNVTLENIGRIAKALKVSLAELFSF